MNNKLIGTLIGYKTNRGIVIDELGMFVLVQGTGGLVGIKKRDIKWINR